MGLLSASRTINLLIIPNLFFVPWELIQPSRDRHGRPGSQVPSHPANVFQVSERHQYRIFSRIHFPLTAKLSLYTLYPTTAYQILLGFWQPGRENVTNEIRFHIPTSHRITPISLDPLAIIMLNGVLIRKA